jgi:hypothetical protein
MERCGALLADAWRARGDAGVRTVTSGIYVGGVAVPESAAYNAWLHGKFTVNVEFSVLHCGIGREGQDSLAEWRWLERLLGMRARWFAGLDDR